ncbi:sigma-54-dependent transcriptional regulator [Geomonas propionica]|uniref:Sigma-54-dependent Fis family transcriptional regulator n=1 Tax=Geomonas propionica TaxID=2798582 RepID=A0ABS0YNP6_9BACT|nr:sigma-54 dependent transcriptional regulator [Geomonas propionica]MBJ6799601.1 sigma-54-dependent Fis family transcriptional regulator [Geomonas propionica]
MAKILIIDDEETVCESMSLVGKRAGHETACARTLTAGCQMASEGAFDLVFLDVRLPDGNGLEMLPRLAQAPSRPEIVIMTGYGDPAGAELAINSGAWDYIEKGSSFKEITLSLVRALEYRKQKLSLSGRQEVVALKRENIVGNSPALTACLDAVARAAVSDAGVLILGETGSGKELFARAVHQNSKRCDKPFVVVDCASLPETLVESLLFGHEKGAFTGAEKARDGLISQAHGGTLFLDEVGELPFATQKAFLRVLQERRYRPVGGARELESDFRLVAATNRNLNQMADVGTFRSDLLFRLSTFVLELPPLRERSEDIKELARYYMDKFCENNGLSPKGSCPEFVETLQAYNWPGNVREFINTIERTVLTAREQPVLFAQHLPTQIRVQVTQSAVNRHEAAAAAPAQLSPPTQLPKLNDFRDTVYTQAEKQYLCDLMALAQHDIATACDLSGLSQSRLYALLKIHDLHRST